VSRQSSRRKGEGDVATLQTSLSRYRDQLMTVTTNREYEAMQHEISGVEARLKDREDQVLGLLMDIDALEADADAARRGLETAADEGRVALAQLADEEQHARLELAALEGHIAAERGALAPETLAMYEKASKRYPLAAVAELKGELCGTCNVRLRPMVVSEIRRGERLVLCDSCSRMLAYSPPPQPQAAS